MKRFVVKCSFGGSHGWGHVIRSSALAGEFKKRGWETCLWSEGKDLSLPSDVRSSFDRFDAGPESEADVLCIDEMYTDQATLERIVSDWRLINPQGIVIGVDDMQQRSMAGFDVVLNTEIGLRQARYEADHLLLGERFALLRAGFSEPSFVQNLPTLRGEQIPVLVMIGGTDPFGYTPRVLDVISDMDSERFFPVAIAHPSKDVEKALQAFESSLLLNNLCAADMAAWMAFCKLGVIACGTSLYEAAAMELPFVGLSIVDNQHATARKVQEHWGLPVVFFDNGAFDEISLAQGVETLLRKSEQTYPNMDAKGVERVADRLEVLCR